MNYKNIFASCAIVLLLTGCKDSCKKEARYEARRSEHHAKRAAHHAENAIDHASKRMKNDVHHASNKIKKTAHHAAKSLKHEGHAAKHAVKAAGPAAKAYGHHKAAEVERAAAHHEMNHHDLDEDGMDEVVTHHPAYEKEVVVHTRPVVETRTVRR